MKRHYLSVMGYVFATFLVQGTSHFAVFARHYARIPMLKTEPNFVLGLSSMLIQGGILSFVFANSRFNTGRLSDAVRCAWLFGAFLVSYIALAEPGKYNVPSIIAWIGVEASVGFMQFTLIGLLYGLAHRTDRVTAPKAVYGSHQ